MNRPLSLFSIALIAFLCLHHRVLSEVDDVLEVSTELHHSLRPPLVTQSESTVLDLTPHPESASDTAVPKTKPSYTVVVIVCVSILICYAINYFTGQRENENLAMAWASKFGFLGDSVLEKNFNLLGRYETDDSELLVKEEANVFKFYASGRSRYCHGMLATMELKSRHDLISRLFNSVVPCKDEISFEVYMNDEAMDHVVFAMARKKAAETMHKELRDLQRFGGMVPIPGGGRKWVSEELSVISESEEVAGDMIRDTVLHQVFGDKSFEKRGKYFISMHFSDQLPFKHSKMLLFKFALPDAKHMDDLVMWVELISYYVDLVGRCKLSPQARDKAKRARKKARQEALQRKRGKRKMSMPDESWSLAISLRSQFHVWHWNSYFFLLPLILVLSIRFCWVLGLVLVSMVILFT